MNLYAELKRRKVLRIAVPYIVLSWVILQVTDVAVPALRLPDWVPSLVFFLCLIGFPFAVLFAWAFELTPEGIRPEREAGTATPARAKAAFAILLLGVAAAGGFYAYDKDGGQTDPATGYESIAILPFANLSGDPTQDYFSDGLSEELLNALSRIPALKVAARTSSFSYKGDQPDARDVGESLDVDTVLIGTVRTSGANLRISVQLIDALTGYNLWSETYDRELTDILDVQDDIAGQVLRELSARLGDTGPASIAGTTNPVAYDYYLKGIDAYNRFTPESVREAQRYFAASTAADPAFADAWSRQASAARTLSDAMLGETPRVQAAELARQFNERAFELDPDLAEAHAMHAMLLSDEYRYEEALESNARAIRAKPNFAEAYLWQSELLRSIGRVGEASAALDEAYRLDPRHPAIIFRREQERCAFYREPLTDEGIAALRRLEEERPVVLALCLSQAGRFAEFHELVEKRGLHRFTLMWPDINLGDCDPPPRGGLPAVERILTLVACRRDDAALAEYMALDPETQQLDVILEWIAIAQLRAGQTERALVSLNEAHEGSVPVAGETSFDGISSNASLALDRVLAHRRLGTADQDTTDILNRVRQLIDNLKANGMQRGYRLLEAKLHLLEGNRALAESILEDAAQQYVGWISFYDPVLIDYLGEERIGDIIAPVAEHLNAERAKLGWDPVEF